MSVGAPPDWRGNRELWPRLDPLPKKNSIYTIKVAERAGDPAGISRPVPHSARSRPLGPPRCICVRLSSWILTGQHSVIFRCPMSYFVEYAVVEFPSETTHWLKQRNSTTYSSLDEKKDHIAAAEIKRVAELSLAPPPRWKQSEAEWATHQGQPMRFVGQIDLPEKRRDPEVFDLG